MTNLLSITDIVRDARPVFRGQWKSQPVSIELDSSAMMKLQGNTIFADRVTLLADADARVTRAAQRLLEDGVFAESAGGLVLRLTGLDID